MNTANYVQQKLLRIGVFYDGNYFSHVSNYYLYQHERHARISLSGLHQFIINQVALKESRQVEHCRVVDAHYFRGRLSAKEASNRNSLYRERQFDEVLMREGVVSHFLPVGAQGEKGIDVWLALEAFELAFHKNFDVIVLVAGDGDYLPLIRKINTIGTRVMVLGWDFSFTDEDGHLRTTRTAQSIMREATYPMQMDQLIGNNQANVDEIFLQSREDVVQEKMEEAVENREYGSIVTLKKDEGYGFIKPESGQENLFFHYSDVKDEFLDLNQGDTVQYQAGHNPKGPCAKQVELKSKIL
ncbi:NYN domain-containing protein [Galenea microaerophila]